MVLVIQEINNFSYLGFTHCLPQSALLLFLVCDSMNMWLNYRLWRSSFEYIIVHKLLSNLKVWNTNRQTILWWLLHEYITPMTGHLFINNIWPEFAELLVTLPITIHECHSTEMDCLKKNEFWGLFSIYNVMS